MDEQKKKKPRIEFESDAIAHLQSTPKYPTEENESKNLKSEEGTSKDYISGKNFNYGFFIELQGPDSVQKKLERPININDSVVLIKDFPNDFMFRGYFCRVLTVYNNSSNISENKYHIIFDSEFDDDDPSRKSEALNPNFEFPTTCYDTIVSGDDIVRLETQDLCLRTYFV